MPNPSQNPSEKSLAEKRLLQAARPLRRFLLNGLALLVISLLIYCIVENWQVESSVLFFGVEYSAFSLGMVFIAVALLTVLASAFRFLDSKLYSHKTVQFSQRKVERLEVIAESSSEQVKMLEQKIDTLEIALQRALKDAKSRS